VIIDASREPRLQLGEAEPFPVDSCEVERDLERSTLTNILCDGSPLALPVGAKVELVVQGRQVLLGW
jgi:hypothetical protein